MAVLLIQALPVTTVGGHSAEIRGIANDTTDCLCGVVVWSDGKEHLTYWDLYGRARDNSDSCNIDMRNPEHFSLRALALPLLVDHCKEYYKDLPL